jgi:hypothetical protein
MRRIVLALALAACASPAFAVQDRYGPPRTESVGAARITPLPAGSMLGWNGKAAAPQEAYEAAPQRPAPIVPWTQRLAPPQTQAQAQALVVPQQQARVLPAPADGPRPFAARLAAAPPPAATPLAPNATERPRVYSVGRQYGEQPDPIPGAIAPSGAALTLKEVPASDNLGRTQAPLDDGRSNQAVAIPVTKDNAAANRIPRFAP